MTAKSPDPMPTAPRCPDCAVALEEGFIPDAALGGVGLAYWHRGKAEQTKIFGLEGGYKVVGTRAYPIRAFRCPKCGLLHSYAFPRVWRKV